MGARSQSGDWSATGTSLYLLPRLSTVAPIAASCQGEAIGPPGGTQPPAATRPDPGSLYEREGELERIEAGLETARRATGCLLLVEGPAGIGKTRLVRAATASAARAQMTVLAARGTDLERDVAWGVVGQWFGAEMARLAPEERSAVLSGAAALATAALDGPPAHAGSGQSSPATVHGLYWLLANLAARAPALLVLDDAHWADDASARFVSHLSGRLADLPVLLLVTTRPLAHGSATHALASVVHDPGTAVVRPAPLSELAVQAVVQEHTDQPCHPAFARACRQATGGNPFLLSELARGLVQGQVRPSADAAAGVAAIRPSDLPRTLLGGLSRAAQALARAVAVLDRDAGLAAAAELAGLDREAATQAVAELTRAGLLEDALPLRFVHALVSDGVLGGLLAEERSAAHVQAARVLHEHGVEGHRVCAHLMVTKPRGDQSVVRALREAARDAARRGDPAAAAAALARAFAEPVRAAGRAVLLEELAAAKLLARDPTAVDHLRAALEVAPDAAAHARVSLRLGEALLFANRRREAHDVMAAALAVLGDREPTLVVSLSTLLAQVDWTTASLAGAREGEVEGLRDLAEREGPRARGLTLTLALRDVLRGRPADEVVSVVHRGLDGGRFLAAETCESPSVVQAVCALAFVDALEDADRLLDETAADAAARGSPIGHAAVGTWRAYVALRRGRVAAAEAESRTVLEHLRAHDLPFPASFATAYLGIALTEQGRLAEADAALASLPLEPFAGTVVEATLREARGLLRRRQGRTDEAVVEFRACGAVCEALLISNPSVYAWRSSLALSLPAERHDEAVSLLAAELAAARTAAVPRAIAIALRAGELLADAPRTAALQSVLGVQERCPSTLERATTLLHLGTALCRENRRGEAREALHAALELAHADGATVLADQARRELRAAGSRPRRVTRTGVDALTLQEHRIAGMAAEGRSNPEIAQALFLSRKTVEMHLGHAYRKLGVASRRELPGALQPKP